MLAENYRIAKAAGAEVDGDAEFLEEPRIVASFRAGTDQINQIVALQMAASRDPEAPDRTSTFVLDQAQARKMAARLLECANELTGTLAS